MRPAFLAAAVLSSRGRHAHAAAAVAAAFHHPASFAVGRFYVSGPSSSPRAQSPQPPAARSRRGLPFARSGVSAAAAADVFPSDLPRRDDVLIAIDAVRRACEVTAGIQPLRGGGGDGGDEDGDEDVGGAGIATVTKSDASPVTVGDFAAQAVVLSRLSEVNPSDAFVAEEGSDALRSDPELTGRVLVAAAAGGMDADDAEGLWRSIDLGRSYDAEGSMTSTGVGKRVWCLDPIDGTKGFLRGKLEGGQYCVALALIEDGVPTIGVLGCPNLPASPDDDGYAWDDAESEGSNGKTRGCIFVATQGGGTYQLDMDACTCRRIEVTPNDGTAMVVAEARFCIGVEKGFGDPLGQAGRIAEIVHGPGALDGDGEIVNSRRIDSQAKFGVLARGGAEVYLRLPREGYREWIWDLAAGSVVITEAGGEITDADGNPLDFSLGAKLPASNRGVVGSNGGMFHRALLDAYRLQEEARKNSQNV